MKYIVYKKNKKKLKRNTEERQGNRETEKLRARETKRQRN